MKGIVFNLLEACVEQQFGEGTWDALLNKAGLEGAYTALGSYPDAELGKLVVAASQTTGMSPRDIQRWFGTTTMPLLIARYPVFFKGHRATPGFLATLNNIIHAEVRKLYPGAMVPEFDFAQVAAGEVTLEYRSERALCAFGEGLIHGAAEYFGERAEVTHETCVHRGDAACRMRCRFQPKGGDR